MDEQVDMLQIRVRLGLVFSRVAGLGEDANMQAIPPCISTLSHGSTWMLRCASVNGGRRRPVRETLFSTPLYQEEG